MQTTDFGNFFAQQANLVDYSEITDNGHIKFFHDDATITIVPRKSMGFTVSLNGPSYMRQNTQLFDTSASRYLRINENEVKTNLHDHVKLYGKNAIVFKVESAMDIVSHCKSLIDTAKNSSSRKLTKQELIDKKLEALYQTAAAMDLDVTIVVKDLITVEE